MYDKVRTATISERYPIVVTDNFVIVKGDDNKEIVLPRAEWEFCSNIPCKGCTRGCYNYQMGDCKDYQWVKGS